MARSRKRTNSEQGKKDCKRQRSGSCGAGDSKASDEVRDGSVFCDVLNKAGLTIRKSDTPNQLVKDQAVFQRELKCELKRHPEYPQVIEEFIKDLGTHLEDPIRLRWSLSPSVVPTDADASSAGGTQDSLIRMLLGLEKLQPLVMNTLLEKLAEFTDEDVTGNGGVNIPKLIMNQFRWLDKIVNGQELVEKLFEVVCVSSLCVQRELVTSLPEVVEDVQHTEVASQLKDLLSSHSSLALPILDCLSNLSLKRGLLSEVRTSVVQTLASAELQDLPVIVRFLLQTASGADEALEVVTDMRQNLQMDQSLSSKDKKNKGSERSTECLVMDTVKSAVRFQKTVAEAWIKSIESTKSPSDHSVLDICVLCVLHSCNYKKPVESLLRNKIRRGNITETLLLTALRQHAEVLRDYFPSVLSLSEVLLRSPEPSVSHFACSMYKHAFDAFDTFCQQEIVGNLVTHIGSGFPSEIDSSLEILVDLVENNLAKMAPFIIFVKGVMDYIDNLSIMQIRQLYCILSSLAFRNPREEGAMQDELHIIIRKQLSNNKSKYKRMGVIGAIMVVKCLAQTSCTEASEEKPSISNPAYKQVVHLLQLVRTSGAHHPDVAALFMDELSSLIAQKLIDPRVEGWISENVIDDFQNDFVVDIEPDKKEGQSMLPMSLQMGLDDENEAIAINLLPLLVQSRDRQADNRGSSSEDKKVSLMFLSPNFRLLQTCEKRLNKDDLEGIDALLGCPVYLAQKSVMEKFSSLSTREKEVFCEAAFLCINWFREYWKGDIDFYHYVAAKRFQGDMYSEDVQASHQRHLLINAFATQTDAEMKAKVITRLQNITDLQEILKVTLPETPGFVPPLACFDVEEGGSRAVSEMPAAGAKKSKKSAPKQKKANGKKDGESQQDKMDTTESTQSPTTQNRAADQTEETGEKAEVDLNRYRPYFREFDLEVFDTLRVGLITKAALDTELNTKNTTTLQIQPPQLHFLLQDLVRKLEHALPAEPAKRKMFLKVKSDKNLGFSHLDQIPTNQVVSKVVEWLPTLCDHLEGTNTFFQTLLAASDGVLDGPGFMSEESQLMAECFQLLLQCLQALFSWRGFSMLQHRDQLKEGLSVLASRLNTATTSQLPLQDLLRQSFEYLGNFGSTVPRITCAVTLCKLVCCIAACDETTHFSPKISELSEGFLKNDWLGADGQRCKGAKHNENVQTLLKLYFTHSEDTLVTLEHIASVGIPELIEADKDSCSKTYPTLTRNSYTTYYRCLLSELVECCKAIPARKQSDAAQVNMEKLVRWNMIVRVFHMMVNLIKVFDARANLTAILKYGRMLVDCFLRQAMPLVDVMFRSHKDDIQGLLKNLQISTRALHHMCGHSKIIKDVALTNQVPLVKKCLETFVYRVKVCLTMNSCLEAFWLGNLKNRDLQGEEIVQLSQASSAGTTETRDDSDDSLPAETDSDSEGEVDKDKQSELQQSYSETF